MPELSLTDEQRERLDAVRRDVEAAFVDEYGRTRLSDAVDYLLDTYTPPEERAERAAYEAIAAAEYPQLQRVASDVSGVPGSGIDADEMRGKLLTELGPTEFAARLAAETAADGDDRADATTPVPQPTDDGPGVDSPGAETDAVDRGGDSDDGSDDGDDGSDDESGSDDGGSPLATANRLLREHDGKWREHDGDAPYEVDLPDGTSEAARTKDDVRRLLFRNY
jgi:hypothetical protein